MRLRQLGVSQSVVFFVPPEVYQSILNHRKKTEKDRIDSYDVICWLLEQTCNNLDQLQPLYVSQGLDFCRRQASAKNNPDAATDTEQRKSYLQILEQPERYTLQDLYAPDHRMKPPRIDTAGIPQLTEFVEALNEMKKNVSDSGDAVQALAHTEVEQEREVEIEVENVREVKKPHHASPRPQHSLDLAVQKYAETGRLMLSSDSFTQAFVALRMTAVGQRLRINDEACDTPIYATHDFLNAVNPYHKQPRDEYARPVHWILFSAINETALIVSDHEANLIIPLIRDVKPAVTHLIAYAAPVTRSMLVFDDLRFYSVPTLPKSWEAPAWLVRDLGIFAGRLYFEYDTQYGEVCKIMGLPPPPPSKDAKVIETELWKELAFADEDEQDQKNQTWTKPFSPNALLFMQEWLAVRRKGQDFSQTMMGEVCRGRRVVR